jgi:hypothetical protein
VGDVYDALRLLWSNIRLFNNIIVQRKIEVVLFKKKRTEVRNSGDFLWQCLHLAVRTLVFSKIALRPLAHWLWFPGGFALAGFIHRSSPAKADHISVRQILSTYDGILYLVL